MSESDTDAVETRVERLERLVGVSGAVPRTRRQVLSGIGGLAAGAVVGRSAADTVTADTHGQGVLGATDDRIAGIHVREDFGPTMSVDAIDGGVAGLSSVESLSGNSYIEPNINTDPTSNNGDVVLYPAIDVLYNEGEFESGWVAGYQNGTGNLSKEADHLYAESIDADTDIPEYTWVHDTTLDLSDANSLHVDWEVSGEDGYIVINDSKDTPALNINNTRVEGFEGGFSRRVESVDISGVTGEQYVSVRAYGFGSTVRAYGVEVIY